MGYKYNAFTGEFDLVDPTVSPLSEFPTTPYVVGPVGEAGYQTIQSALDAANAAGGGIVYVQPGSYTENLTLYDGTQVVSFGFSDTQDGVNITGTHTPPTSGGFVFRNVQLISATDVFSSAAAGTAHIVVADAAVNIANGYLFNLPNWGAAGILEMWDVNEGYGTNSGCVNNTGGATVLCYSGAFGVGSTNTMIVSGAMFTDSAEFFAPIDFQTGAQIGIENSIFYNLVTASNNSTGDITNCSFQSNGGAAFTMSSSANISLTNCAIATSNDPAIDGAGVGTLTLTGCDFNDNTNLANTLTMAGGVIHGGNFVTQFVVGNAPDAHYQTIQSAIDAATAAGGSNVIWIQPGTYTENLNITSDITFMSIDGVAIIDGKHTPPTSGTVTFDGCLLMSATHILDSNAAGSTTFNINNGFIIITNGYIFNLPNWTGEILMDNCGEASTNDGVINNVTGSSDIKLINVEMGAGNGNTMQLNGGGGASFLRFDTCNVNCPVNMVGSGSVILQNGVKFANTVTIGGSLNGFAIDTNFRGGANQALTFESSGNFSISNGEIQSTNNPAIGGSGSGTLTLTSIAFPDDNNIAGTLTIAGGNSYSGTYKSDYTDHGVLLGQGTVSDIVATAAGTNGQLLIGGTGVDPAFANLTSTGGTIAITEGANTLNVEAAASIPTSFVEDAGTAIPALNILNVLGDAAQGSTTAGAGNTITISNSNASTTQKGVLETSTDAESVAGASTTVSVTPSSLKAKLGTQTSNGLPYGGGTAAALNWLGEATNGQIPIGSTGNPPVLATVTAGAAISVTNGAGSITIASTGGGLPWTEVTGVGPTAMSIDNGYIANNAALVTLTLPNTAAVGDTIKIDGSGAGGWLIAQNAGETIHFLGQDTTTGVGGSLASSTRYDCITLRCIIANTDWVVESVVGNLTVV